VRYSGILFALLAVGTSIGCGTSLNYISTNERPHTLYVRRPEQVEIFMTGKPDRPFVEIGMIESLQEKYSQDDSREIIAKMRAFAGTRGCDALTIFSGNDAVTGDGGRSPVTTLKGYRGACLVYVSGPPTAAAAAWAAPARGPVPAPIASQPLSRPPAALSCMPNATQLCYGPGGCRGAQRCAADGRVWTMCDCGAGAQQAQANPSP
jgi:hypothetical protein